MTEMIERVAEAIEEAPHVVWRYNPMRAGPDRHEVVRDQKHIPDKQEILASFVLEGAADEFVRLWNMESRARAAILAMREPTEEMLPETTVARAVWADIWPRMIDSALKEGE